jgi:hypothetical protein
MVTLLGLGGCGADEGGDPPTYTTAAGPAGSAGSGGEDGDDEDMKGDSDSDSDSGQDSGDDPTGADPTGDDPTGDDPTGADPTGDDSAGETDGGDATTGVMPGDEEYNMCIDMSDGSQCEVCACDNCLQPLTVCQMDPGCIAIRDCARENGCTGIECLGPCGDVINMHGGALGESTMLASALSDCYTGACPGC